MKTQTPKTQISDLRPVEFFFFLNIYIANSSQFLAPNVSWSRNVHRQQPETKEARYLSSPVHRCRVDQTVKIQQGLK